MSKLVSYIETSERKTYQVLDGCDPHQQAQGTSNAESTQISWVGFLEENVLYWRGQPNYMINLHYLSKATGKSVMFLRYYIDSIFNHIVSSGKVDNLDKQIYLLLHYIFEPQSFEEERAAKRAILQIYKENPTSLIPNAILNYIHETTGAEGDEELSEWIVERVTGILDGSITE